MLRDIVLIGPVIARSLPRSRLHVSQGPSLHQPGLSCIFSLSILTTAVSEKNGQPPRPAHMPASFRGPPPPRLMHALSHKYGDFFSPCLYSVWIILRVDHGLARSGRILPTDVLYLHIYGIPCRLLSYYCTV